jgi:hypothetical protein
VKPLASWVPAPCIWREESIDVLDDSDDSQQPSGIMSRAKRKLTKQVSLSAHLAAQAHGVSMESKHKPIDDNISERMPNGGDYGCKEDPSTGAKALQLHEEDFYGNNLGTS